MEELPAVDVRVGADRDVVGAGMGDRRGGADQGERGCQRAQEAKAGGSFREALGEAIRIVVRLPVTTLGAGGRRSAAELSRGP